MSGQKKRIESPTHVSWRKMRERCINQNCRQWPWYGALGVTFCERWQSFENFLADMGERPAGTTLDRIDGKGNYEPGNCRWATPLQQSRNQRHCIWVEYRGERVLLRELCEQLNLKWMKVYCRLRAGMSIEEAVSLPHHQKLSVARGVSVTNSKLTAEQVRAIRAGGKTQRQWARDLGVSLGCVEKAARGVTHAHIQ